MRELAPVDLAWIADAPLIVRVTATFAASPARVFDAFADAAGWTRWFPLMHRARWIGEATGGVGAEREVALRVFGGFRERFLAWDPGRRFSFTMIATSSPLIARMGEDYVLAPDRAGARLDWTMGAAPRGPGKALAPGLKLIMHRIVARAGHNLDRQLSAN
jgi:uncharacterized protein YndB with AHSA1/START domain